MIDVHGHIWLGSVESSKQTVLRLCERYAIEKVFISTLDEDDFYPDPAAIRKSNNETIAFMKEHPGLIEGMAYVSPDHSDTLDELRRCIEEHGMRGIKLWVATFCDEPCVDPVAEYAIGHNLPVLIHAFYKTVRQLPRESRGFHVRTLAKRYPDLRILMAHIGANVYDAVPCIADCPNVYVDFSGSLFRRDDLDYTIRHLGVERVLFGSDMPGSFECCVGQVFGADLDDAGRQKVFHDNAISLFKLGGERA